MFTISAALASCAAPRPFTGRLTQSLGPNTPILVTTTWGTASDLAERIRVRGPDGDLVKVAAEALGSTVRLSPRQPWAQGEVVVEERADFDIHGKRVFNTGEPVRSAWFTTFRLQADNEVGTVPVPEVDWGFERGVLVGTVPARAGVLRVELEVRDVGTVSYASPARKDEFRLSAYPMIHCNDTFQRFRLPVEGLTVRTVAHDAHGGSAASPWVEMVPPAPIRPQGSHLLASWTPVRASDDTRATTVRSGSCVSMNYEGTSTSPVHRDTTLHTDQHGTVHRARVEADRLLLDGKDVSASMRVATVLGTGDDLLIYGYRDGRGFLLKPGSAAETPFDATSDIRFEWEGVNRRLEWRGSTGRRYTQLLDGELGSIGPVEERLQPIEITTTGSINGRPIGAVAFLSAYPHEGLVAVVQQVGQRRQLALYTEEANLLWAQDFLVEGSIIGASFDAEGITFGFRDAFGVHALGFTFTGLWRDVAGREVPEGSSTIGDGSQHLLTWSGHQVRSTNDGVYVQTASGPTPRLPTTGGVVGIRDGFLTISRVRRKNGEIDFTEARYSCSDEARGVPLWWP